MRVNIMAKRVKQTPAERAYSKQVKRIKQFIRRAEKRGYQFSEDVLPQRPKRVTQASVRKLAKLTPEKLYQKAVYGGLASEGEIVPASEGVKLELSLRAKKAAETRKYKLAQPTQEPTNTPGFEPPENLLEFGISNVIVQNFKSQILHFPKEIADKIIALINTLVSEQGIEDVAYSLQHMPMQFYEYINRKWYDSNAAIQEFSSALIEYLPNASDVYKEDLMDAFEYNEIGYTIES